MVAVTDTIEVSKDELEALVEEKVKERVQEETAELREEFQEENDRLRDRVDDLAKRTRRAERVARASTAHARRLWDAIEDLDERTAKNLEGVHSRISAVQESSQEVHEGAHEEAEALLPIQQMARMPEEAAKRHLNNENHRNTYRARFVWRDWSDYARKTPAGYVIASSDLRRVLYALDEEEQTVDTTTVKRVMDRLVEYSKGIVEKRKNKAGEWIVVLPENWREQVDEVSDDEGVSVVSEGE